MEELNKKLAEWLFPLPEYRVEGIFSRFIAIDRQFTQEAEDYILSQDSSLKGSLKVGEWYRYENIPILTDSLDACFKRLVPKAIEQIKTKSNFVLSDFSAYILLFGRWLDEGFDALALCKAIEKLIDANGK